MSQDDVRGTAREIAGETRQAAIRLVAETSPWIRDRARELSTEMKAKIEQAGVDEHEAYEAAVKQLVSDLRQELEPGDRS